MADPGAPRDPISHRATGTQANSAPADHLQMTVFLTDEPFKALTGAPGLVDNSLEARTHHWSGEMAAKAFRT